MLRFKTNILTPLSQHKTELLKNVFLMIEDKKISSITTNYEGNDFIDRTELVCIPGLIDTHVHLSQFHIRGSHSPNLLHWLNTYTFKEEQRSQAENYARQVALDFFEDSLSKGTTTSVIYTAPFKQACDIAFQVANNMKVRVIIGMTMMDAHSPEYLQQQTTKSFEDSLNLFEKWNQKTDLLEYVFTPRFALTCSADLMQLTGDFAQKNQAFIQTHLSENKAEIERALELFPQYSSYTEIYEKLNILGPKTILGHVIHVNDNEIAVLKATGSKIAHCPDSNFFIKSGMFQWERLRDSGIEFSLASDVAGGTSLSMLNVMKMAAFRQENYLIPPEELFYYSTLGSAVALGKEKIIGSVEMGKEADLVFMKIPKMHSYNTTELLSKMIYTHEAVEVVETLVQGNKVF